MGLTAISADNIFKKDVIGNVRTAQEDSHEIEALTPNGDVFVVCDGMGGHVGGKTASSIAVKCILEHLIRERYPDPVQALDQALQFANMQILGYANEHPELKGMGTTACILLLRGEEAFIAHVGDSRIYLYLGKEKQLHRVTKDHSYVQTLVDLPVGHPDKISDEEAESHPNKNRILKALGIKPELKPTISVRPILPKNGDIFLICSDGLSGMITDKMIRNVLSSDFTIEQKGESLIDLALEAGGQDNITVELIQISDSPHKRSAFRSYNPKPAGGSTSGNDGGRPTGILKWAAVVVSILVVGFGVLYLIGHSNRYKEIKKLESTVTTAERESARLNEDVSDAEREYNQAKIATQTAIETLDLDEKALENAIKSKQTGKDILALQEKVKADKTVLQRRQEEEDDAKQELEKRKKICGNAEQSLENLNENFPSDSTQITERPWWEFLKKSNENESNNNR